uniref:Chloroplast low molecular weight heat shock protein HSP26.8 n=1 Tax=Agrostis stolonifera var. palustris TaxID=62759 RepID=Q8GV37_AGRST|nr:chloroplast low molecular weight heat shock protein HSP26.8 [Agrostis stolonifera var. palustris]
MAAANAPFALVSRLSSPATRLPARAWRAARPAPVAAGRTRPLTTASASQENRDNSVDVQVSQNGGNQQGNAVQRRPRRAGFDISPFGLVDPMSPMRTMRQMLDTMDRLFDDTVGFPTTRRSPATASEVPRMPWDIMEDDKEVKMRFDMPGLSRDEVKVMVEDDTLVIRGEHKKEAGEGQGDGAEGQGDGWWKERSVSSYDMRLTLPDECDKSQVRAELKNGVLLVTVPKTETERKVIDVQVQ